MNRLRVLEQGKRPGAPPVDPARVAVEVAADATLGLRKRRALELTGAQLDALEAAAPYALASPARLIELGRELRERGRCAGADPEAYFPVYVAAPERLERLEEERAEADRLCQGCPVRGQCLAVDYAAGGNRIGEVWGVAAGLGARDRRSLLALWVTLIARLTEARLATGVAQHAATGPATPAALRSAS